MARARSTPDDVARVWRPRRAARALAERDPRLARVLDAVGEVAIPQRPSTFATIARAICYQQLHGRAARAIWERLLVTCPAGRLDAAHAVRKREATYRRAGLSAAKTAAIRDLARHVVRGHLDPEALAEHDDEAVVEALCRVKGIGPWSAHMHLIFSLARPDVWPTGDLGVRTGLARLQGLATTPTPRETQEAGEAWRPHRTVAAWLMWRVHDVGEWD